MSAPTSKHKSEMEGFVRAIAALGPAVYVPAIICLTAPIAGSIALFTFAGRAKDVVVGLGTMPGAAALTGAFAALTGLALMPTYAMAAFAGFAFGFGPGAAVAVLGVTFGGLAGYGAGTVIARKRVMDVITNHPKASVIRGALVERGFLTELGVITLIRIPPNSPFALTNLVLSATRVNPVAFTIGTAVGMAPRTVLAAFIGAGVAAAGEAFSKENSAVDRNMLIGGLAVGLVILFILMQLFQKWAQKALDERFGTAGR